MTSMAPYIPVFLDSGGVINDNHVRGPLWVACYKEHMPTLGLAPGVTGDEWVEALALVIEEERRIDIWAKLLTDSQGYLEFERKYFFYWINALARILQDAVLPATAAVAATATTAASLSSAPASCSIVQLPSTKADQIALAKSIHAHCVARIRADIPGAREAILEMRTTLGCKLYTSSSELSTDLHNTFKTLDLLTLPLSLSSSSSPLKAHQQAHADSSVQTTGEPVFTKLYGPDLIDELKNSTRFYEKIFADCGEDPKKSVVVDDKEEMLAAAKVLGCTTVLIRAKPLKGPPTMVRVRSAAVGSCGLDSNKVVGQGEKVARAVDAEKEEEQDTGPLVPAVDVQLPALADLPAWIFETFR